MIALYTAPEQPDPRQQPLAAFLSQALAGAGQAQIKNCGIAAVQFARFLRRPAVVADLSTDSIADFAAWLAARGKRATTVSSYASSLVSIGRLAADRGIIELAPTFSARARRGDRRAAFTAAELERLIAAAAAMPGDVASVPSAIWWPAFILATINTQLAAAALIDLPLDAFDAGGATLRAGGLVYWLHPHTVAALSVLVAGRPVLFHLEAERDRRPEQASKLFPWPGTARKPAEMLLYHLKRVLRRAGVPSQRGAAFDRLRAAVAAGGTAVLDGLDAARIAAEQLAIRERAAAEERRQAEARHFAKLENDRRRNRLKTATAPRAAPTATQVVPLGALDPERTLLHLFTSSYRPLRLAVASPATVSHMLTAIARFQDFLGCVPTIEQLTETRLEEFAAWTVATGRSPATANSRMRCLTALANFCWRKRKTNYQIREAVKLKENKRVPRAWTIEEVSTILRTAAAESGTIGGIPAGEWWTGLLLLMYDTGLRLKAALALRASDLQPPYVLARAETQKQRADQVFKLSDVVLCILSATRPAERELLFPHGHESKWLHGRLRSIIRRAGFECSRRDLFHKLRRTSASYLALVAGKAAAQDHLGHSGPKVTAAYLDPTIIQSAAAADLLPRPTWRPDESK